MKLLKKTLILCTHQKTYRVGLLYTKAYRILKNLTNRLLDSSGISAIEWALIGTLHDNPQGLRFNKLAEELGVEAPFITRMIRKLSKIELIEQISDSKDNRAKLVGLTERGKRFVDDKEPLLRKEMKGIFKNISKKDLLSYLFVLKSIVDTEQV